MRGLALPSWKLRARSEKKDKDPKNTKDLKDNKDEFFCP